MDFVRVLPVLAPASTLFIGFAAFLVGAGPATGGDAKPLFEDGFAAKLQPGWTWVHEVSSGWKIGDDGLQVRALPGTLWLGANNARNILVRDLPKGSKDCIIEVTVMNAPAAGGEQAGLVAYHDDDNYVKLVKESLEGKQWVVMGREETGKGQMIHRVEVEDKPAHMRLAFSGDRVAGSIQSTDGTWMEVGRCPAISKPPAPVQVGVLSHGGPNDVERWATFKQFRISAAP